MATFLWAIQIIVSVLGVFIGFGWIWGVAFREDWKVALVGVILMPIFLPYFIVTRWSKYQLKYPVLILVVTGIAAALLQRARLGYWAWPDVERSL
jgi:hypothetical protein